MAKFEKIIQPERPTKRWQYWSQLEFWKCFSQIKRGQHYIFQKFSFHTRATKNFVTSDVTSFDDAAEIQFGENKFEDALAKYEESIKYNKKLASLYTNKAACLLKMNKF